MDRRLGRPLPCQLANPTRVHLIPPEFFTLYHAVPCAYAVLAAISNCYPPVWGRLPTRYSPVRHSVTKDFIRRICPKCFVRLACVKHAASVHPEPGSNSLNKCLLQVKINSWLIYPFYCFFKDLSIVRFYDFKKNFRGMCFTVQLSKIGFALPFVLNSFAIISCRFLPVKNFFQLFWSCFCFSLAATLISYHIQPAVVKNFFISFLQLFARRNSFMLSRVFSDVKNFFHFFPSTQKEGFEPSHGANRLYP